jgi:hypothetical protein
MVRWAWHMAQGAWLSTLKTIDFRRIANIENKIFKFLKSLASI